MDIAYENIMPAYLESNQLIFEYENIGAFNSVLFPINTVDEFKPEITVPYNLNVEKELQQIVDNGNDSWRLNPINTAHFFIISQITEPIKEDSIHSKNISLLYCNDSTAVLKVNDNQTNIHTLYLKRLIKQDPTGIWTIIGYDTKDSTLN